MIATILSTHMKDGVKSVGRSMTQFVELRIKFMYNWALWLWCDVWSVCEELFFICVSTYPIYMCICTVSLHMCRFRNHYFIFNEDIKLNIPTWIYVWLQWIYPDPMSKHTYKTQWTTLNLKIVLYRHLFIYSFLPIKIIFKNKKLKSKIIIIHNHFSFHINWK